MFEPSVAVGDAARLLAVNIQNIIFARARLSELEHLHFYFRRLAFPPKNVLRFGAFGNVFVSRSGMKISSVSNKTFGSLRLARSAAFSPCSQIVRQKKPFFFAKLDVVSPIPTFLFGIIFSGWWSVVGGRNLSNHCTDFF
jgi:hypothetical protein